MPGGTLKYVAQCSTNRNTAKLAASHVRSAMTTHTTSNKEQGTNRRTRTSQWHNPAPQQWPVGLHCPPAAASCVVSPSAPFRSNASCWHTAEWTPRLSVEDGLQVAVFRLKTPAENARHSTITMTLSTCTSNISMHTYCTQKPVQTEMQRFHSWQIAALTSSGQADWKSTRGQCNLLWNEKCSKTSTSHRRLAQFLCQHSWHSTKKILWIQPVLWCGLCQCRALKVLCIHHTEAMQEWRGG